MIHFFFAQMVVMIIQNFVEGKQCMLTVHVRVGTASRVENDEDSLAVASEIAKFAYAKRLRPTGGSFVFCYVCHERHVSSRYGKVILNHANKCGGVIELSRLTRTHSNRFVMHLLRNHLDFDIPSMRGIPKVLLDYIFWLTRGLPVYILETLETLEKLKLMEGGYNCVKIKLDSEALQECRISNKVAAYTLASLDSLPVSTQVSVAHETLNATRFETVFKKICANAESDELL